MRPDCKIKVCRKIAMLFLIQASGVCMCIQSSTLRLHGHKRHSQSRDLRDFSLRSPEEAGPVCVSVHVRTPHAVCRQGQHAVEATAGGGRGGPVPVEDVPSCESSGPYGWPRQQVCHQVLLPVSASGGRRQENEANHQSATVRESP